MIPTSQDRNTKIPPSQVDLIRYWKKRAEAAEQRELELRAVIAIARTALRMRGMHEVAAWLKNGGSNEHL